MATLRTFRVVVAIAAVCLIGQEKFVSCDDPDGLTDFCVGVLPHDMHVWETGTEVGDWEKQGYDPSKMGAYNASAGTPPSQKPHSQTFIWAVIYTFIVYWTV